MRARIYCRRHKRRHSAHAAMHCREVLKPGLCLSRKLEPRGERCPDGTRPQEGTVTITRDSGLISVRPLRRRREYVLPLAAVAEMIVARVSRAEVEERRNAKRRA